MDPGLRPGCPPGRGQLALCPPGRGLNFPCRGDEECRDRWMAGVRWAVESDSAGTGAAGFHVICKLGAPQHLLLLELGFGFSSSVCLFVCLFEVSLVPQRLLLV